MNLSIIGWGMIAAAVILLVVLRFLIKNKTLDYLREFPQLESLRASRISAIEGGLERTFILGHQLSSQAYPGLGLIGLAALPEFLNPETMVNGQLNIASSDGSLVTISQQVVRNCYQNGFSKSLTSPAIHAALLGPTVYTFTAGMLAELGAHHPQNLIMSGDFGPEAALWSEAGISKNCDVFASGGTITSQATLFTHVKDLLIGESSFLLSSKASHDSDAGTRWLTEDILRLFLILFLILGSVLKAVGVL